LGAQTFKNNNEEGRIVYTNVTEYKLHEKYNPVLANNDIALIKLPAKVTFSAYIQTVQLPKKDNKDTYENEIVTASGWGLQHDNANVADELQYVSLTVITNKECVKQYNPLVVRRTNICAKGEEKESVCQGDSGK
jgi:hypothetical protein